MTHHDHSHDHGHDHPSSNAEQWEARYASSDRIWSGKPNALLVEHIGGVTPGSALELGCGEGGDAIWLAQQGWHVTASDIAQSALTKAAAHAADAGVADRIVWVRHDLAESFPEGSFDLVTASYFHSWVEIPREAILGRAARAVAPGGRLVVIGHAGSPSFADADHPAHNLPNAAQTVELLGLAGGGWTVEVAEDAEVAMKGPDGEPATRPDCVVVARRDS